MFSLDLFIIIITNTCFYIILSKVNSCEGLVFLTKVTFLYVFVVTLLEKLKSSYHKIYSSLCFIIICLWITMSSRLLVISSHCIISRK